MITLIHKQENITCGPSMVNIYNSKTDVNKNRYLQRGATSAVTTSAVSNVVTATSVGTNAYNVQLQNYITSSNDIRRQLTQRANDHIRNVRQGNAKPTATLYRNKNSWGMVKRQVVREELMKLQISGKTDLPLTAKEVKILSQHLNGKDLTLAEIGRLNNSDKKEVATIINKIVHDKSENARVIMEALNHYKKTGEASSLLQVGKLEQLKEELNKLDLSKLTKNEFNVLVKKYCEVNEFHHRESISQNPNNQNNTDNIEVLKTSDHNLKHTGRDGKVDYRKPLKEKELNRQEEMQQGNKNRVMKNELKGLGLAVAIGIGVGITMSFMSEAAMHGISPDTIDELLVNLGKSGIEAGTVSAVMYGVGRLTTMALEKLGHDFSTKIGQLWNTGAVGSIMIAVTAAMTFARAIWKGERCIDALKTVGKQVLISGSILAVSLIAQAAMGGPVGLIVSTSIGVTYMSCSVYSTIRNNTIAEKIRVYTIKLSEPEFA